MKPSVCGRQPTHVVCSALITIYKSCHVYLHSLFVFLPLFHLPPSFSLLLSHFCKSVNLAFSPHFTGKKVKYFIYSGVSQLLSPTADGIPKESNLSSRSNPPFFDLFHSFYMIFKTEFKIKWLVNLVFSLWTSSASLWMN